MTRLARSLKRRVAIQRLARVATSDGGATMEYQTEAMVWSGVTPLGPGKPAAGVQADEKATHRFTMRFGLAVTTDHFLLLEGATARRFRVRGIANQAEAGEALVIEAEEIALDEEA